MPTNIPQPRNESIKSRQAAVRLAWNKAFSKDKTAMFGKAQTFVDSECIRLMVRYTPARNNILYKTPTLGTKLGSGRIYYQSPCARYQYYGFLMVSSVTGSPWAKNGESKVLTKRRLRYSTARHPQAQARWFEAMKTNHRDQIRRGAAAYTKRGR